MESVHILRTNVFPTTIYSTRPQVTRPGHKNFQSGHEFLMIAHVVLSRSDGLLHIYFIKQPLQLDQLDPSHRRFGLSQPSITS